MVPQLIPQLKEWKLACPKTELDLVFPNPSSAVGPMLQEKSGLIPWEAE